MRWRHVRGLRIAWQPQPARNSVALTLRVAAGSVFEPKEQTGAAHFLEHLVLRGSRRFPLGALRLLERSPKNFVAGTNRLFVTLSVQVTTERLEQATVALLDAAFFPLLRPEDIARERRVVIDEIGFHGATPVRRLLDLTYESAWPDSPFARSVSGTAGGLGRLRRRDLVAYHGTRFLAQHATLAAAGAVDFGTLARGIERVLAQPGGREVASLPAPPPARAGIVVESAHGLSGRVHILAALVAQNANWMTHLGGRTLEAVAARSDRGPLARALRNSRLGLYAWDCRYYEMGNIGFLATIVEVPQSLAADAARALIGAITKIRRVAALQGEELHALCCETLRLVSDDPLETSRHLADSMVALSHPHAPTQTPDGDAFRSALEALSKNSVLVVAALDERARVATFKRALTALVT